MHFQNMAIEQQQNLLLALQKDYAAFQAQGLKLDMSRGKPGADQLALSMDLLDPALLTDHLKSTDGFDIRNYGCLEGLAQCRALFAEMLEVPANNILVFGNSSLSIMYDYISFCMSHGPTGDAWHKLPKVKFACPVPGYDRHFAILEQFGIEMVCVPMTADGPDMDCLEALVQDEAVKGMICVPKYSNPQGITFADTVVNRIAAMRPAAKDFRIIWDNAYCVHDLRDKTDALLNIFDACRAHGSEDMVIEVTSTSKITFPGAGIAAMAASDNNIAAYKKRMFVQTIGHDKLNQMRHVQYFGNLDGIRAHMQKHRAILEPKFDAVVDYLQQQLGDTGIAAWNCPNGGYFISLDVLDGCAKRVGVLCKEAGVVLTTPGATYPYNNDPRDRNIRIAPTLPPVAELNAAMQLLCLCVKIAALEKLTQR